MSRGVNETQGDTAMSWFLAALECVLEYFNPRRPFDWIVLAVVIGMVIAIAILGIGWLKGPPYGFGR